MARLIIVRHAESAFNLQNRIQGHMDSSLTKKGMDQARRLAARIRHFHIDKIYSSDLGRAYSTTREITRFLKRVKIIRDPRLREILLGDWEGMTPEDVDRLYEKGFQKWLRAPSAALIPNAEPVARFRRRVTRRIEEIARHNRGKTVLVVTHGGVLDMLWRTVHGLPLDGLRECDIPNTGINRLRWDGDRLHVVQWADAAHLEGLVAPA